MTTTSHILMVRPVSFAFNEQTASTNAFQMKARPDDLQHRAVQEFDAFAALLRANGINVLVVNDTPTPHTPDSIFPNNWISFHENGTLVLYPMQAENRRLERKPAILDAVRKKFRVNNTLDLSKYELQGKYLEGTGSMVLDREYRIAYACLSSRTNAELLKEFCTSMGFRGIAFDATDEHGTPIYHTNVMMCVADRYVVICLDAIRSVTERILVEETITTTGKQIIDISQQQMNSFAGNMLQIANAAGEKFLVMSTRAYESLTTEQRSLLHSFNNVLHSPLDVIEQNGGGSARCMIAEVFLPPL